MSTAFALCVLVILRAKILTREATVKGFNTEYSEKNENTENSCYLARARLLGAGKRNFPARSGLRIVAIGRMKLKMLKPARMRIVIAGCRMTRR